MYNLMKSEVKRWIVPQEIHDLEQRMPKRLGSMGYDPWGYNPETAKVGLTFLKFIYDHYFRVEAHGLENISKIGSLFVISNHSGQLPIDGTLIAVALATNPDGPRSPRIMIERFFPTVPYLYNILIEMGGIIGDPINCVKMLENGEVVVVFPEGVRGSGKPYKQRYELQYMGTGFIRIAMQTGTPIVPVGVVGCEETMPSLGNLSWLARLMRIPYVPIALPFPLPAKVYINFGKPIRFEGDSDDEPKLRQHVETVKDRIRILIEKGQSQRGERII